MLNSILKTGTATLLGAAILAGASAQLSAQSTNQPATGKERLAQKKTGEAVKQRKLPYAGNLTATGKTAKTFTVGKRVFTVCPETRFFRGDEQVAIGTGVPGEYLTLSYVKAEDGSFIAQNVYFGGKKTGAAKKKKQKEEEEQ